MGIYQFCYKVLAITRFKSNDLKFQVHNLIINCVILIFFLFFSRAATRGIWKFPG